MGPFSLNLILALVLLLPGFVSVLTIQNEQPNTARRALPASNSFLALAFVPLFALVTHALWAAGFALNALYVEGRGPILVGPFALNPYETLFKRPMAPVSASEIAFLLAYGAAIALSPALWASLAYRSRRHFRTLRRYSRTDFDGPADALISLKDAAFCGWGWTIRPAWLDARDPGEDWLNYLARISEPDDAYLACHVLTTFGPDGGDVGYTDAVEDLSVDEHGEIASITLDNVSSFTLTRTERGFRRVPHERRRSLSYMTFRREQIHNTSFVVVLDGEDVPSDDADAETALSDQDDDAPYEQEVSAETFGDDEDEGPVLRVVVSFEDDRKPESGGLRWPWRGRRAEPPPA